MRAPLEPGARIDRFQVVRLLGVGGMGVVYEARDPELARSVALKLIHEPDAHKVLRLLREAQALAQLQHPNVVAVHDVGTDGDQVFIAMELVDGTSLDRVEPAPSSWREVVGWFVQAGRGLVGAHDKGLVHRDIKPSNLLVDRGGRVRVGDFGLARMADGERRAAIALPAEGASNTTDTVDLRAPEERPVTATTPRDGLLKSPLTGGGGGVIGTPKYMAPELFQGAPATPASDQYSFCVALDELLPRVRPRWLASAVARGMATDPAARHPSMKALVELLEHTPAHRRRLAIAVLATGALAAGAAMTVVLSSRGETDPCASAATKLRGVWDPARRAAAEQALVVVDPTGAKQHALATAALDRQAARWSAMQIEACRANKVTRTESDTLFDRRMRCLDRRLGELRTTADALAQARDLATIDRVVRAARQLGGLEACANADALLAQAPLPDDPATRAAVEAVYIEIESINNARRLGTATGLETRSAGVVEKARATKYAPVLSAALRSHAQALIDIDATDAAAPVLRELTEVAAEAHDDANAAWAWAELLRVVGWVQEKYQEAYALLPAARAAMKRAPADPLTRARFLAEESMVLFLNDKAVEARARNAEGRQILVDAGAATPGSPLAGALAGLTYRAAVFEEMVGNYAEAERGYRGYVDMSIAAFGPDHPLTADAWHSLGEPQRRQGHHADAIRSYSEAVRIKAARQGETPTTANTLIALADSLQHEKRFPEALAAIARAETILRNTPGSSQADLASAISHHSIIHHSMGNLDEAIRLRGDAIALYESAEGERVNLGRGYFNRAELAVARGRCDDALTDYQRAIDIFTEELGAEHPQLVYPLSGIGRCQVLLGEHGDAIKTLDRALALQQGDAGRESRLQARYYRGRALVESGRDRASGMREVRAAHVEMTGNATLDEMKGDVEKWLATRR